MKLGYSFVLALLVSIPTYPQSNSGGSEPTGSGQKTQSELSLDVQEAALRQRVKTWTILSEVDCVTIEGKDAPPALLARFQGTQVRAASQCEKQAVEGLPPSIYVIVDKQSKKPSTVFQLSAVHFVSPTEAEVVIAYETGSQVKASDKYKLKRNRAAWEVADVELLPSS
jgi:hypothetical protein